MITESQIRILVKAFWLLLS